MKRTWTIIGVGDVPGSFKWYQALFGQPATLPAHDYFGQILDSDGTVLLCLHEWGTHEHPSRSRRILRFDQCALCGVTRRCSCRALAGASWGSAVRPRSPRRAALAV
jgi:hypothetical protein